MGLFNNITIDRYQIYKGLKLGLSLTQRSKDLSCEFGCSNNGLGAVLERTVPTRRVSLTFSRYS